MRIATLLALWASMAFGAPSEMTKIVVRLIGPSVKPNSHAALPKTIYVADPHYARIEDPPDARQGIQKLTIVAEPDAYSVNLIDRKGTHAIDQGGANDLHLPIILPFDPRHQLGVLDKLEFGDEFGFFQEAGATYSPGPIINAKPTDAFVLHTPHGMATLVVRSGTHIPITISWQSQGAIYTYEYVSYQNVPFNPALFKKPEGIAFREIPVDKTPDQS